MNDYTPEAIDRIRELAAKLTPLSDIAILMGLDYGDLRRDISERDTEVSRAYYQGKAETALKLRENELVLAEAGSPLAVTMMSSYLRDMDTDEDL